MEIKGNTSGLNMYILFIKPTRKLKISVNVPFFSSLNDPKRLLSQSQPRFHCLHHDLLILCEVCELSLFTLRPL